MPKRNSTWMLCGTLLVAVFMATLASANENITQILFKRYTVEDGLPNNYSEIIFVDSEGLVCVGGQQGLSMFDAYNFTNYYKKQGDSTSICSNQIADIFESSDSSLWIGTYNGGLCKFDRWKRDFKRYNDPRYGINSHTVRKIVEDKNHKLWLGTRHGLFRFDPISETAKQYIFSNKYLSNLEHTATYSALLCARNGAIWAGSGTILGLYKYNQVLDSFLLVQNDQLNNILSNTSIWKITEDSKGNIWIATTSAGIIEYLPSINTIKHYSKENGKIHSNNILYIFIDRNDNIWFSTANNEGLAVLLNENFELIVYKADEADQFSIPSNSITSITQDDDGNYWVSSHGGGIAIFRELNSGFSHYKMRTNAPNSLSYNIVSCFAEDAKGAIWIGTDGGGFNKFDRSTNTFTRFSNLKGLRSKSILSILPISDNELMLSGWDFGISVFNTNNNSVSYSITTESGKNRIKTNNIKYLYRDSNGIIWHGNHALTGLSYQLPGEKIVRQDSSLTPFLFSFSQIVYINQVLEDSHTNLWIATQRGLYQYKDSLRLFAHNNDDTISIASNYVTTIFEDSNGNIWIGTAEGLQLFNRANSSFTNYTIRFGLPLFITGILEDNNGFLWISSTEGIMKFNPQTGDNVRFDSHSGLQATNFFERSCFKTSDGEMFFGSTNGFTRFFPDQVVNFSNIPKIKLTDFQVFNNSKFELIESISKNRYRASIPYDWSVLSFEYSVLSYWSADKNIYQYMLDGFDKDWCDGGNTRKATYTNLDPGTYTFKVRGANNTGVWNNEGFSVELTVRPPFWLTWWFRLLVTVMILTLLFGFYFYRIASLNSQKIRLENEVKKRTYELKMVNANLEEQKEEILIQNEQLEQQKKQLEEYNESILRKTGEVLLHREKILDQNEQLEAKNHELDQLVKTKDKFFSIIAHDLKNPINAIMGFSELMMRRFNKLNDDKKKEFILHINLSANSIYNLLINLLDWARSQSQNLQPKPKNYALTNIFEDNRILLSDMAESKGIQLHMYTHDSIIVYADINILNTVIRNLVSNSVKFTNRDGIITVIAQEEKDWVHITVQDTGIGMSEEKLETLFSIEKNSSTNGTEREKGTGLGLLVVKEFVLANGGKINVSSTLGEGSKFTFTVPSEKETTTLKEE